MKDVTFTLTNENYEKIKRLFSFNVPKLPPRNAGNNQVENTKNEAQYQMNNEEKVVAIFDYQASSSGELNLRLGEVIKVIKKDEETGWWYGEINEQTKGFFPSNFVKKYENITAQPSLSTPVQSAGSNSEGNMICIAVSDYLAKTSQELPLSSGDVCYLLIY